LHTAEQLQKEYGVEIKYVDIDDCGIVNYEHLEELLQSSKKAVVSLMHVNNEIGNILDIEHVAVLCKTNKALFHTDSVQSVGHYKIDLKAIPIDFLAASAHKFHGPKGVGFCFVRKESGLKPLIFGGEQERGYRAGTESIHNIAGMDEALKMAYTNLDTEKKYVAGLKAYFIERLNLKLPNCHFNGCSESMVNSTYTLINVALPVAAEKAAMLQFQLDLKGIACSKGSACQSGSSSTSHVLKEISNSDLLMRPSIRFSFSIYNTKADIDYVIDTLVEFTGTLQISK
jgi:cysteine desulfurase